VATVIRAIALNQVSFGELCKVASKEALSGALMGGVLGLGIIATTFVYDGFSFGVAITVAISLPVVSLWANFLGAVLPLIAMKLGQSPAVTSAPLMTTIVDSTGLMIYFLCAKMVLPFYPPNHPAAAPGHALAWQS
jgi:Mg/Co/Ni transporter MgtE